tara:strand:+ start:159 stop:818 length:660 start_codon:yes stop_codon:yes gene_type:complete
MRILAIIPARAKSIRLKNKNRLKLGRKSLIKWTIDFVLGTKFIKDIVLSTDDEKIINENISNDKIKIFKRPSHLKGKNVKTISVIIDVIKKYEKLFNKIDTVILFQATSPFRSKKKIDFAIKKFIQFKMKKSVISVSSNNKTNQRKFIIKNNVLAENKDSTFEKKFVINGNFYIASKKFLIKYKSFFTIRKTYPVVLNSKKLQVDIDTKKDFNLAKNFI